MKNAVSSFEHNVFINCPLDDRYNSLFLAVVFTVHMLGFRARCSQEINDSGRNRLEKIMRMVGECRFGIHDLSRIQRTGKLPRFNMPFELGLDLGLRHGGNKKWKTKSHLVLETEPYRYKQFISDLAGVDVSAHNDRVTDVISAVRDWLNSTSKPGKIHPFPSGALIYKEYRKFRRNLPGICKTLDLHMNQMTFTDYSYVVAYFLSERAKKLK
jgi:hypothetical protein